MGLGGIHVWQLVIILIVFLVALIAAVPIRRSAVEKSEDRNQGAELNGKDDSTDSN
ncbi:MAG: twin-arginine translocase TatA/TatE family subunit [Gammaproteobacteria bacterium]